MWHFPEGHVHASLLKQMHRAQQRQLTQPLPTAKSVCHHQQMFISSFLLTGRLMPSQSKLKRRNTGLSSLLQ